MDTSSGSSCERSVRVLSPQMIKAGRSVRFIVLFYSILTSKCYAGKIQSYHKVSHKRAPSQRLQVISRRRVTDDAEMAEWLQDQSLRLGDGPRPGQVIILLLLWSAAAVFSLDNVDIFTREGLCVVWRAEHGWNNFLIWIFVGKSDRIKSHTNVFLFFSWIAYHLRAMSCLLSLLVHQDIELCAGV